MPWSGWGEAPLGVRRVRDQGDRSIGGGRGWRGCRATGRGRRRARPAGVHRQPGFGATTAPGQAHEQPRHAHRHCNRVLHGDFLHLCPVQAANGQDPRKSTRSYVPHCLELRPGTTRRHRTEPKADTATSVSHQHDRAANHELRRHPPTRSSAQTRPTRTGPSMLSRALPWRRWYGFAARASSRCARWSPDCGVPALRRPYG